MNLIVATIFNFFLLLFFGLLVFILNNLKTNIKSNTKKQNLKNILLIVADDLGKKENFFK
jgi:hypothetical protein